MENIFAIIKEGIDPSFYFSLGDEGLFKIKGTYSSSDIDDKKLSGWFFAQASSSMNTGILLVFAIREAQIVQVEFVHDAINHRRFIGNSWESWKSITLS